MRWLAALTALCAVGCNFLLGYTVPTLDDGDADAGDAASDASVYGDLADETRWSVFDLATVTSATGYSGGTFDGKYVYFAPGASTTPNGLVVRYDTTQPLVASAWDTFDLTHWAPNLRGYEGAVHDANAHVYFIPHDDGLFHGRIARYTSTLAFGDTGSWDSVDLATTVGPSSVGFGAGAFDGRFVYFTPFGSGTAVRYDTSTELSVGASYTAFHLSDSYRWRGAAFDGRYVYFIPHADTGAATFGAIARVDTLATFDQGVAWQTFDLATRVDTRAYGFFGAVYDGRYLYLVPSSDTIALRFDTLADFGDPASWTKTDLAMVSTGARGYAGGVFDGRYVYYAPSSAKLVLRFDTTLPFDQVTAFQVFDPSIQDPGAFGFAGAVFDGSAIYFVPSQGTVMARFQARTVPASPATFSSSFY